MDKVVVPISVLPRELLERMYREIQAKKAALKFEPKGA